MAMDYVATCMLWLTSYLRNQTNMVCARKSSVSELNNMSTAGVGRWTDTFQCVC